MKTLKEFTFEALNANSNLTPEEISGGYTLYREDQRDKILQNPPSPDSNQQELDGYAQAIIETNIGSSINSEQLPQYMAQYMGEPGITTEKFLNGYFNLMRPPEAVDPLEGMRNSLEHYGVKSRSFEDFSLLGMPSMTEVLDLNKDGKITWEDTTDKETGKLTSVTSKGIYNVYNFMHDRYLTFGYPFMKYIDQFPSMYRGVKETFGWEDIDIPILDDVAGFTGSFMLYEQEQVNKEIEYYKENGMENVAAYTGAIKGATDTIVFLRALGKMRVRLPGRLGSAKAPLAINSKSSWIYRGNQAFKALANSQKIALISAMSAEGVTMEDRVAMWKITSLYAATPAVSGQLPGPVSAKIFDAALNLFISERREGGLKDIRDNPNLSSLEKAWAMGEIIGYDAVFSGITQSYGKTANQIQGQYRGMQTQKILEPLSLKNPDAKISTNYDTLIKDHFGADWTNTKGGLFTLDKMEIEIKKTLNAEEDVLRVDLEKIEREAQLKLTTEEAKPVAEETKPVVEEAKPVVEETKPVAEEAKPVVEEAKPAKAELVTDEVTGRNALDTPAINVEVKRVILDGLEANKNLPTFDRAAKAQMRRSELFDALDAPAGTPVKTVINKINNVRKNKPVTTLDTAEYYKLLEKTAAKASTEGSSNIQKQIRLFSEFARENLPYRKADQVIARLQKLAEEGHTPMKFNDKAAAILDRSTAMERSIEQVVGIKDMSQQVDMTEAEMLRTILKEKSRAATGGYRSAIDKIVASQKVATNILKEMPPQLRGKMISKMKQIASAKTDATREKRLAEFEEYSSKIVKSFERKSAQANLDISMKEANKLLKSKKVTKQIKSDLEEILTGLESGKIADNIDGLINKATTSEQQNVLQQLKLFTQLVPGKKNSDLTASELNAKAEMLNTLVEKMNKIVDDKVNNRKTKVEEDLISQRKLLSEQKEIAPFWSKIKNPIKKITKELSLIPRGNGEALDFYDDGVFTKFQERLELDWIDIDTVLRDVDRIMLPVSKKMEKKGFSKNKGKMELEVTTIGGKKKKIKLGIADRSRIYLGKQDPETWQASLESGWKLGTKKFVLSESDYNKILTHMKSKGEIEISEAIADSYKALSKYTDEASMRINGFPIALDIYTGPRLRENAEAGSEGLLRRGDINLEEGKTYNEAFNNFMVEHSGRFKARTKSDSPLIIYNPESVLSNVSEVVAYYYGRGETLKEINMFFNEAKKAGSYDPLEKTSIKDQYTNVGRQVEYESYKKFIEHISKAGSPESKYAKESGQFFFKAEQAAINYLGPRALGLNPKVAATQLASLPTAAAVMRPEDAERMYKAFGPGGNRTTKKQMQEESAYLYARYSTGKIGYMYSYKGMSAKDAKYMQWITNMDAAVIGSIHSAMKQRATDEGFKGDEMLRKAEEYTVTIMMKSQPTFEDVSRPLGALTTNPLIRMSFIFSSQRNKNYYLNYNHTARYINSIYKNGIKGSEEDLKNLLRVQVNLGIATAYVGLLNTAQRELRDDIAEEDYDSLPPAFYEYTDKEVHEKLAENILLAQFGNMGAFPGAVTSFIQYKKPGELAGPVTPYDTIFKDAYKGYEALQMTADFYEIVQNGTIREAQEWLDDNKKEWMKKTAHGVNAAMIIPGFRAKTGAVPVVNAYKYFVESPEALIRNINETKVEKSREEREREERIEKRTVETDLEKAREERERRNNK